MTEIRISKDVLWKGAIEDLVEDFLYFFFEPYMKQIDLTCPVEFLDKELDQLFPVSSNQARRADRLLKVRLKDHGFCFFLVHVEVQGYDDKHFAKRMFQCYYRLREKFEYPITALVIYTNNNPKHHYNDHQEGFMGTELIYRFPTFNLREYPLAKLAQLKNPFGILLETAWYNLEQGKRSDEDLISIKLKLIKRLYERGYEREKIEKLLSFVTYYQPFEQKENFLKFEEIISKSYEPMGIREAILNEVRQQSLEKGIEKGKASGDENRIRIAVARMHGKGLPAAEIADFLGISIEKVEAVIKDLEAS